jgi:hypothetical protein
MHMTDLEKIKRIHSFAAVGIILLLMALTYLFYDRDFGAVMGNFQGGSLKTRNAREIKRKILGGSSKLMSFEKEVVDGVWKNGEFKEEIYLLYVEKGKVKVYSSESRELKVYDKEEYMEKFRSKTSIKTIFLSYLGDISSFMRRALTREDGSEDSPVFNSLLIFASDRLYHFFYRDVFGTANCVKDDISTLLYLQ